MEGCRVSIPARGLEAADPPACSGLSTLGCKTWKPKIPEAWTFNSPHSYFNYFSLLQCFEAECNAWWRNLVPPCQGCGACFPPGLQPLASPRSDSEHHNTLGLNTPAYSCYQAAAGWKKHRKGFLQQQHGRHEAERGRRWPCSARAGSGRAVLGPAAMAGDERDYNLTAEQRATKAKYPPLNKKYECECF